jgi:DNA-binding transcriptional MerR regulator
MSKKESNIINRQNNWINAPKERKTQLNFNKRSVKNSFKTLNYVEPHHIYNKMIPKKGTSFHDMRSSSTIDIYSKKNNSKNGLSFFPINLKAPILNNSSKNIDSKNKNNKDNKFPVDIIKIPKTNLNNSGNNKIIYNFIKMNNTNKNKDSKNIKYILSASSKNNSGGIFKKKILNKNNGSSFNNLSNSITYVNNTKVSGINSTSNIVGFDNTNININNNKNRFEAAQKEKERLNILFNEKVNDSKKMNERIKDLENKNKILIQKIELIKKENDNYSSTLDKMIKLIKLLKNNGIDVAEILKNLSQYDHEESDEEEKKEEDIESVNINKEFSFKKGELANNKHINYIENTCEKINEILNENKMELDEEIMTKLNFKKINQMNNNDEKNKLNEEFSFKNNILKKTNATGE